jgi:hypothetical protein
MVQAAVTTSATTAPRLPFPDRPPHHRIADPVSSESETESQHADPEERCKACQQTCKRHSEEKTPGECVSPQSRIPDPAIAVRGFSNLDQREDYSDNNNPRGDSPNQPRIAGGDEQHSRAQNVNRCVAAYPSRPIFRHRRRCHCVDYWPLAQRATASHARVRASTYGLSRTFSATPT